MKNIIDRTVIIECRDISSKGSGFVISADGFIATNNHVVTDIKTGNASNDIWVIFDDSEKVSAKIISNNKNFDFAILKIEKNNLSFFELGNFGDVKEFSDIYFCGQGLDVPKLSLHKGWISRKVKLDDGLDGLQIDGAINSGNSGGPVVNSDGKVVAIITRTEAKMDSELFGVKDLLFNNPIMSFSSRQGSFRLGEILSRVIFLINRNRFVGIGYAVSIDYLKEEADKIIK